MDDDKQEQSDQPSEPLQPTTSGTSVQESLEESPAGGPKRDE